MLKVGVLQKRYITVRARNSVLEQELADTKKELVDTQKELETSKEVLTFGMNYLDTDTLRGATEVEGDSAEDEEFMQWRRNLD